MAGYGALAGLALAYVLSQFFRSFLAVLSPALKADIGATPGDLSTANGFWFLGFALLQIPVGLALDRWGPRRTTALLLGLGGGGGAALFALASTPAMLSLAMALIGAGCAPVLMAAYFVIARTMPARRFATLGASMVGAGSLGNLAGAAPLAAAVTEFGWRATMGGLAAATILVSGLVLAVVRDPPRLAQTGEGNLAAFARILSIPGLWLVLPMIVANYAPAAGVRGLWAGPYLVDMHGATIAGIGAVTFSMALAMIAGNFFYGPLDAMTGTRKWVILPGNALAACACLALALAPASGLIPSGLLLVALGFTGATYALVMAHGRAFLPADLTGRGMAVLNFLSIGSVGVTQFVTGRLFEGAGGTGAEAWSHVFGFYAALLLAGLIPYTFSRDRTD